MKLTQRIVWIALLLLVGAPPVLLLRSAGVAPAPPAGAHIGNVAAVEGAYARWRERHLARGGDRNVTLQLGWSEGLSAEPSDARGGARFDFRNGIVRVEVGGLTDPGVGDVWLVDNQPRPGDTLAPEPGDRMVKIGRLHREGDRHFLTAVLGARFFGDFAVDQLVVTRRGVTPDEGGILFGSLGLFERLEQKQRLAAWRPGGIRGWLPALLGPRPAFAAFFNPDPFDPVITFGAKLFFEEDFDGNGRTCGTCHPANNNFTIDPDFIATLPKDDLLFIAEFPDPGPFNPNPLKENFEKPKLMRGVGLILENVDGVDDLPNKFAMRGVPHTLALSTSLVADDSCVEGTFSPDEATGWSCDGAADDGSLLFFAKGAVFQHFPKTLARDENPPPPAVPDFRFPTDEELDAMAMFQLALGRSTDPNLPALVLHGPLAAAGKTIFLSAAARCNGCHGNAGANQTFLPTPSNRNFATGIETQANQPADIIDPTNNRRDGGFNNIQTCTLTDPDSFGDCTFNTPPLVEAADTPPFFHNNSVATLESSIAFYNSIDFRNSPSGNPPINLSQAQVDAIGAFLRVLNALENIRSAVATGTTARNVVDLEEAAPLLTFCAAETEDAIEVLTQRGIERQAIPLLQGAFKRFITASTTANFNDRVALIDEAIVLARRARNSMSAGPFWT